MPLTELKRAADTVRMLAVDAVNQANSGHTGTAMALADAAMVLWTQFLRFDPKQPNWANRDRFVLSNGHASMLQYAMLHLTGYDVSLEDIRNFRQWHSITPGHPEVYETPGVEMTTGPLGQGLSSAVGMAMAEAHLAAVYNSADHNIVDHHTYVFCGDGDVMEGVSHEAAALAAHWKLGKLIAFFDDNKITIDGGTDLASSEDVLARFNAYGWHTIHVEDGHDMEAIHAAIVAAREVTDRPTMIGLRTHIGLKSPAQDTSKAHGALTGEEMVSAIKQAYEWTYEPFTVPDDVAEFMQDRRVDADASHQWAELFKEYALANPALAAQFARGQQNELPDGWTDALPTFDADVKQATRAASGKVLEKIVPIIPYMVGGSADLTGSNNTLVKGMGMFQADSLTGRYLNYGVREHGMAAISNGIALHGGLRPYSGTFLIFSDYARGAIRLGALMKQPVVWVFTHDSIGLGEDGPTHQPISQIAGLRAIPNLCVFRPADGNETAIGWKVALERTIGPTALILTRQKLPTLAADVSGAKHGAYVLADSDDPQALILATGSEVSVALDAHEALKVEGIATRVVSMPSWELFEQQSAEYRDSVLPRHITARVSIEAAATIGWHKYVGSYGTVIGLDHFGASAPAGTLFEKFDLTAERVADEVRQLLS